MGFRSTLQPKPHTIRQRLHLRASHVAAIGFWALAFASGSSAGQLSLSWIDNSDNEAGFEVERSLDGESFAFLAETAADTSMFSDESVKPGVPYQYRVRAFNEYGYSGYTNVSIGTLPNTAPVIEELPTVSVLRGASVPALSFIYADTESGDEDLSMEVLSSNLELLPLEGISYSFAGGEATLELAPAATLTGSSTVTVLLSDGAAIAEAQFLFEVLRNTAPTMGSISAKTAADGIKFGPIAFSVNDAESPAGDLTLRAVSQNEAVVASDGIVFGGSGKDRTITLVTQEGAAGSANIVITLSDGVNTTKGAFTLSTQLNGTPVVSGLADSYSLNAESPLTGVAFSVADQETLASDLVLEATSSNTLLLPNSGIRFKGTGSDRTLEIHPAAHQAGQVTVTVSVFDGVKTGTHTMEINIVPPQATVKMIAFRVEDGLAVAEVENRPGAEFTLWKTHSLVAGSWEQVTEAEVIVDAESTFIVDPTPVDAAVCYRVFASQ